MSSGEEKAWTILRDLNPADVCRNASVSFDEGAGKYLLESFGMVLSVVPEKNDIYSEATYADLLLNRLGYFSRLAIPVYLISAMEIPLTGRLVKPVNVRGGNIFFRGSHVLPLDQLAQKYGNDKTSFLKKGTALGGTQMDYGDASLKLLPFPRVPVIVILWQEDEEFPPRADLLFDSTCEFHLPLDVLWSIAMESLLIMM